jgi:carbon-monoxide dehydrogenase large subunit
VGEAGAIPTGAAFAQAVEDALAGTGVEILEIPLSPSRLFALAQEAERTHRR